MAKNGGEKGNGLNVGVIVILIVLMGVLAYVIWAGGHNFITWVAVRSRQWQLAVLGYAMMPFVADAANGPLQYFRAYAQTSTVDITFGSLVTVLSESGRYLRWLYLPILAAVTVWVVRRAPTARFKQAHTMKTLAKQESKLWPEISPVLGLDLFKGDITKGAWRVSLTEWEFARKFKLLAPIPRDEQLRDGGQVERLDCEAAQLLFAEQLGPQWQGYAKLPAYAKGIFAALATRVAAVPLDDFKGKQAAVSASDGMFRRMATDFADAKGDWKKVDFSWADAVAAKALDNELVKIALARHAYVFTVMATLLQVARSDGVVASAMFTWLRPVDRRLWYILNGVGGYTFVAESAGIAAHWLAEKEIGSMLLIPHVSSAVNGLQSALEEYIEEDPNEAYFK
jgi:intracellular multiplication protein IcmP